jgi:hypothetical protein
LTDILIREGNPKKLREGNTGPDSLFPRSPTFIAAFFPPMYQRPIVLAAGVATIRFTCLSGCCDRPFQLAITEYETEAGIVRTDLGSNDEYQESCL